MTLKELSSSTRVAWAVCIRGMQRIRARPVLIIPTVVMPVVLVVSFSGSFSSLTRIDGYGTTNIYNWMAPYAALQGAVFSGIGGVGSVADDIENGFFDRLLLTPGSHSALLVGTVGYSALRAFLPTTAVLLVSLLIGGLTIPGGLLGLAALYLATASMAIVFCLTGLIIVYKLKTHRSLMLVQVLAFGALFISVGQVPLSFMQGWLHTASRLNPVSNVLELARQGFLDQVAWNTTWPGLIALAAMIVVTGFFARRGLYRLTP